MSDLNALEQELAEAIGTSQVSQQATAMVVETVDPLPAKEMLYRLHEELNDIAGRAIMIAEGLGGTVGILKLAAETREEGVKSMRERFGESSDARFGFDLLIELKLREAAKWETLHESNEEVGDVVVGELTEWALGFERDHLGDLRDGSLDLVERDGRSSA